VLERDPRAPARPGRPDEPSSGTSPPPWVPLLRRLTELSPLWGSWKNADAAIAGHGDIDSVSSRQDRDMLVNEFRRWAAEHGMGPMFTCPHLPGSFLAVAVRGRELVELQLMERAMFRGATLFGARDLAPMMLMDRRGFRRLRPGAEALLVLFHMGLRWGGRANPEGLRRKPFVDMMQGDPEGMRAATEVFGSARGSALTLATAVLRGDWDRRAAIAVEAHIGARGLRNPGLWLQRARYQFSGGRYCPMLPVLRRGRRIEGDVDSWIELTGRSHAS
jgi:hypothetical protein